VKVYVISPLGDSDSDCDLNGVCDAPDRLSVSESVGLSDEDRLLDGALEGVTVWELVRLGSLDKLLDTESDGVLVKPDPEPVTVELGIIVSVCEWVSSSEKVSVFEIDHVPDSVGLLESVLS
jgi:hypothetical protein